MTTPAELRQPLTRPEEIFQTDLAMVIHRTDRMFFWLLIGQWVGAILIAIVWSPRTWIAQYWSVHQHVLAAAILGGLFAAYPLYLIIRQPGTRYTRHIIAIGQMLQSALLVHVTGGRIETHFHVFGSLALLAFYRDWPVLMTGTAVVYLDHLALGFWFPLSVYGVLSATVWRSLEHAVWVLFEVVFLSMSCRTGIRELRVIAQREAQLEGSSAGLKASHAEVLGMSAKLQEANQGLEAQVKQRTGELQQVNEALGVKVHELELQQHAMQSLLEDLQTSKTQLEQQAKELQAANTKLHELGLLKDEFVAKVSHELRTPLTSIKEGLGLLLDDALGQTTPEQKDFLKTMDEDIDRLAELINNMLDISKIEAGRMQLIRTRVTVPEFVASVVRSCQPILGQRTVNIECSTVSPVFVDRNRMLQVLTNLCSNAIKATATDGTICFRVTQQEHSVLIAVEDNGAGIASEDLPKLFQKFSQVGSLTATRQFGTGLGLTVCKELTELHGGRIDVRSQLGRGTTFTVLLPAYSDVSALIESFREMRGSTPLLDGQVVGVVAVQAEALLTPGGPSQERRQQLDRIAEEVRRNVHRGDIVLTLEPFWIVVLAVVEPVGIKAIVSRLQSKLRVGEHLRFGVAVSPTDGADAAKLFACATARLDQGVEWLDRPEGPRMPSVEFTR